MDFQFQRLMVGASFVKHGFTIARMLVTLNGDHANRANSRSRSFRNTSTWSLRPCAAAFFNGNRDAVTVKTYERRLDVRTRTCNRHVVYQHRVTVIELREEKW